VSNTHLGNLTPGEHLHRVPYKSALAPIPEWAVSILGITRAPMDWDTDSAPCYTWTPRTGAVNSKEEVEDFTERDLHPEILVDFIEKVTLDG
jgi:hypothetical protein